MWLEGNTITNNDILINHENRILKLEKTFDKFNKSYVVVTFLAVLEMAKKQELTIYQENNFDNIICEVL